MSKSKVTITVESTRTGKRNRPSKRQRKANSMAALDAMVEAARRAA